MHRTDVVKCRKRCPKKKKKKKKAKRFCKKRVMSISWHFEPTIQLKPKSKQHTKPGQYGGERENGRLSAFTMLTG